MALNRHVIYCHDGQGFAPNGQLQFSNLIILIVAAISIDDALKVAKSMVTKAHYQVSEINVDYYRKERAVEMQMNQEMMDAIVKVLQKDAQEKITAAIDRLRGR